MGSLYKYDPKEPTKKISRSYDVIRWRHRPFYAKNAYFRIHDFGKFVFEEQIWAKYDNSDFLPVDK